MIKCDYCDKEFKSQKSMTNHRRHHYSGFTEKYKKSMQNYKHTEETKKNISLSKLGEKNGMWKGDNVGLIALHEWIRNHKLKPEFCEHCNIKKPYDLANISGEYKRDINDFKWLCRSCHMIMDYKSGIRKPKYNG